MLRYKLAEFFHLEEVPTYGQIATVTAVSLVGITVLYAGYCIAWIATR